jgi:hypothetical protein
LIDKFTGKEGLFENSPFDERTRQIISRTKMPMGILIDKDLQQIERVFIPIFSTEDSFLLDYVQKLIYNNNTKIEFLDNNGHLITNFIMKTALDSLEQKHPNNISVIPNDSTVNEFLDQKDLMLISLESWKKLVDSRSIWLSEVPSVLILKQ